MNKPKTRIERDTLGEVTVPADVYFGAQTQRAIDNFKVSGLHLQPAFVWAQAIIKQAAARANLDSGKLDKAAGEAVIKAADEVISGKFGDQFVVDVFQAGAGTSQNMDINEVIANRAIELAGGNWDRKNRFTLTTTLTKANRPTMFSRPQCILQLLKRSRIDCSRQ